MSFGVVMLAHGNLRRAVQVVEYLCQNGVHVALHVDRGTCIPPKLLQQLKRMPNVFVLEQKPTPWGGWGLVDAAMRGCRVLLRETDVGHICLLSGRCVPLSSVSAVQNYLATEKGCDFIESVRVGTASWAVQGLREERFQYRFPFCFRRQRRLFDLATALQRRLPVSLRRQPPTNIALCMGSQWWCLSRETLMRIFNDPELPELIRYFRKVWIPDESFFQSLARRHGRSIRARSLTWAPFDRTGRPLTLYDDHLPAVRDMNRSRFFARKVWPGADKIYDFSLSESKPTVPGCGTALRGLARGAAAGLSPMTPAIRRRYDPPGNAPYTVLYGADALFPGIGRVLDRVGGGQWLGPVFHTRPAPQCCTLGGLPKSSAVARANPSAYIANLLSGIPGHSYLVLRPGSPEEAMQAVATDPFARVVAVAGAWSLRIHQDPSATATAFATSQQAEDRLLWALNRPERRADVRLWSLEEAITCSDEVLGALGLPPDALPMADFSRLSAFLNTMRDAGLNPTMSVPTVFPNALMRPDLAAE